MKKKKEIDFESMQLTFEGRIIFIGRKYIVQISSNQSITFVGSCQVSSDGRGAQSNKHSAVMVVRVNPQIE